MKIEKESKVNIAKGKWLKLGSCNDINLDNAKSIDDIINDNEFWDYLELNCMSECCGINAFRFWQEDIEKVTSKLGRQKILTYLLDINNQIYKLDTNILISTRLNNMFLKINQLFN